MRIHNVIITTTGTDGIGAIDSLDRLIRKVLDLRKTPILVVGPEGDSVLLSSKLVEDCELVFDPNYEGHLFSSVKAGLHATVGPAFVLPLKEAVETSVWENTFVWETLEKELDQPDSQTIDVLRLVTQRADSHQQCYPQVITPKGVKSLLNLEAQTDWTTSERVSARVVSV